MIDSDGYRANVGIVVLNDEDKVLWARRIGQDAWQFPQGGIRGGETPEDALYRELFEEVGLNASDVEILGTTKGWLKYDLPDHLVRRNQFPVCVGQKQVWFLLRLNAKESAIDLKASDQPEFDDWKWIDYWQPVKDVVSFKMDVYSKALKELSEFIR